MKIAIVTLEAFNELDSFVASAILNRVPRNDWSVQICCPTDSVTSMNGVRISAQQPIEYANDADVVLFGSGMKTAEYATDRAFLARFALDKSRQLIGAQCSGALFLHRLGLGTGTLSTDTMTAPHLSKEGVIISDRPLHVQGNIASAGGCLASHYLAAWVIAMKTDWQTAAEIIHYVAPVGQKDDFVSRAHAVVVPMLP
ncbi:DJ-1/PfpI family protein [Magnetovibrio sp.]|uniref:DJ-1/PfpI family protein n=1 Tax=Magnetovibrio sp. TaxID=2024836 RepID=UPI002F950CDE